MALQIDNLGKTPSEVQDAAVLDEVSYLPESAWLDGIKFKITDWTVVQLTNDNGRKYLRVVFKTSLGEKEYLYIHTLLRTKKVWYSASQGQSGIVNLIGDLHTRCRELVAEGKTWKQIAETIVSEFKDKDILVKRTKLYPRMSRATATSPSSEYIQDYPMFSSNPKVWDNLDI